LIAPIKRASLAVPAAALATVACGGANGNVVPNHQLSSHCRAGLNTKSALTSSTGHAPTLSHSLRVFATPRRPPDRLPPAVIARFRWQYRAVRAATNAGQLLASLGRRLVHVTAPVPESLYAVPTTRHWVCLTLSPAPTGVSCADRLTDGIYWLVQSSPCGTGPTLVSGLAGDSVRRVVVSANGRSLPAHLAHNAFVLTTARPVHVDSLVVVFADGRRVHVGV